MPTDPTSPTTGRSRVNGCAVVAISRSATLGTEVVRRVDPAVRSAIRPAIAWVDRQIIPIDALRPAAVDAVAAGDAPRPWSGVALDDLAGSGAGVA